MAKITYFLHAIKLESVHRAVAQPCVDQIRHNIIIIIIIIMSASHVKIVPLLDVHQMLMFFARDVDVFGAGNILLNHLLCHNNNNNYDYYLDMELAHKEVRIN
jgi:hypothetical protein